MGNTNEKYTVSLVAKTKAFIKNMGAATKAMKMVGDMNRGIIKNMQQMSSAATKAGGMFNQTQQKMRTGADKTKKATDKGAKSWKKYFKILAAGTGVIGLFGLALVGISRLLKRARIGAAIEVQAKAFSNLAASHGSNAKQMMLDLREASKGTVDNLQLMTTASRAIMLGIAPTKLVNLMRIARASAKAMGTTVSGAFSDIALGIGRQSRLILDNLGIIVRVKAAYDRYAFSIGTTADALTDYERQQAFANEVQRFGEKTMENRGDDLLDFQDKLAQVDTTMKNVSQTINLQLTQAFVALYDTLEEKGVISGILNGMAVKLPEAMAYFMAGVLTLIDLGGQALDYMLEKLKSGSLITAKMGQAIMILVGAVTALGITLVTFNPALGLVAGAAAAGAMALAIKSLNSVMADFTELQSGKETGSLLSAFMKNFADISKNAKKLGKTWSETMTPDKTQIQIALRKLNGFNEEVVDGLTSSKDLMNTWSQLQVNIASATRQIRRAHGTLEGLPKETHKFTEALVLAESVLEGIRDNVLLVELGVPSQDEFNKTVRRAIAKMDRALSSNLLKSRESKSLVFEELFKGVADRHGDLTPESKAIFLALQKEFGKLSDIMETLPDTFGKGLNKWVDDYRGANDRMTKMGVEAAKTISKGFETFFFDAVTGKLKTLKETFANFGEGLLRSVSKALGDKATEELLSIVGKTGNQDHTLAVKDLTSTLQQTNLLLAKGVLTDKATTFKSLGTGTDALKNIASTTPGFGVLKDSSKAGLNESIVKEKSTAVTVSILDKVKLTMTNTFTKFSDFMSGLFKGVTGMFQGTTSAAGPTQPGFLSGIGGKIAGAFGQGGKLSGVGSFFSGIGGFVKKIFGFADGGITSLAGSLGGAMMTTKPTLAAISETGKREAIVPLEKFAELIQQPSITINAVDSKSFAQYVNENKETLLGAINSVRSPQNMGTMNAGPY
jgi:hypothetical protein